MIALPAAPIIRRRGWVLAAWAALFVLFAPRACRVQQVLALRGGTSEATEATRATDLLKQAFRTPFADYVGIVVHGPVRWTNPRFAAVLDTLTAAVERRSYVGQVISVRSIGESSFVSQDRRTTFLIAALTPQSSRDLSSSYVPDLRATIGDALARVPGAEDFEVMVTGFPALDHDVRTVSAEDTERGEQRALPLTLLVLIVAFGALVAAALPVVVGVLAITIALGLVTIAARYTAMSVFVLNITTMVGLGVGIDYSLLIVTRFREELNRGLSPVDAAIRTVETAGSAVVTSGLTVVVGFAALVATPLSDTRSVGIGGLLVVAMAVLLATTFLPAALAMLGRGIDRPRWLARPLARFHAPTGWERWARWLGHRPWRAVAVGGTAIALLTFPLTQIRLGLPATNWFPPESESARGLQALREMGASGVIQPVRVVVQLPEGESAISARRLPGLKALTDSIRKDPRVREVRGVASVKAAMSTLQLAIYYSEPDQVRAKNPKFFDAYLSPDNRVTLLDVIPADTVSLTGLMDVVRRVRGIVGHSIRGLAGAEILVAGFAASNVDTQHQLMRQFPKTVGLVLGITAFMLFCLPLPASPSKSRPLEPALGGWRLRAHGAGVSARLRRTVLRTGGAHRGDLGRRPGARVRHRVRPVDGLRGVPAHPRQRGVRQDRPQRPRHHGRALRHGVHHHERGADHDPGVRDVRVHASARRAADRLRPGGRRTTRRHPDPHGPGAGDHAHRRQMELVARCPRAEAREAGRRLDEPPQSFPPYIPVPRRHSNAGAGIFQRLVLQPLWPELQGLAQRQQPFLVGAHQVNHGLAADGVAVKPHAAVEGEAHPLAAAHELLIGGPYWQVIRPSDVAGATGDAPPENRAHCRPGA